MYEIKRIPEDFVVEEITEDGEVLEIGGEYAYSESKGDHLICVLIKNNWDTQMALKKVSDVLHVSQKRIGFAGTKDKRALTSQRISLWNVKKEAAEALKIKDIRLKPLKLSTERLTLGMLKGNRFTIKIYTDRKLGEIPDKIPNYYGEQRFGSVRPITHLVGKALVRNNPEEAVKIYLGMVFDGEAEDSKAARKRLSEDWDYKKALGYFPQHLSFERTMIAHLAEYTGDYIGALRRLPKTLVMMFVHAYQSDLFNKYIDMTEGKGYKEGQLFGSESDAETEEEKKLLADENVDLSGFRVKCLPEASSKGLKRDLWLELSDFSVLESGEGYYLVQFSLPRGTYATTVIDYLFK